MRTIILVLALFCLFYCLEKQGDKKFTPPTPHINAPQGSFAKTVLLPGDPKRAKYVAEKFLKNAELVNDVRGIQGYTGYYKNAKVSVMASGMGMPSMGIYSYELFNAYDVENIIRVGSIGSIKEDVNLKEIVVATSASTNSNYGKNFHLNGIISGAASYKLVKKVDEVVEKMGISSKVKFGQILSSDTFYTDEKEDDLKWAKMGVIGVEMEGYALYLNAARAGKNALVLATVSDQLVKKQYLSAEERQLSFDEMLIIALEAAASLESSNFKNKNSENLNSKMTKYLLVAIDLDGTLLTSDKRVLPETIKDISEASEKGIHIVYCTGRGPAEMKEYLGLLPSIRYGICLSGALVYDFQEHKEIYINSIPKDMFNEIIEANKPYDGMIHLLTGKESIVREDQINHMEDFHMGVYTPLFKKFAKTVKNIKEEANKYDSIPKINIYFHSEKERNEVYEKLKNLNLDFTFTEETSLEINAKDTTKGSGLLALASYLGIPLSQIIGIGDGNNDYSFLKIVGLPIAMGNANENIKNISKCITDDNNNNGSGKAIRKYCLHN